MEDTGPFWHQFTMRALYLKLAVVLFAIVAVAGCEAMAVFISTVDTLAGGDPPASPAPSASVTPGPASGPTAVGTPDRWAPGPQSTPNPSEP